MTKPMEAIQTNSSEIRRIAELHGASNIRLFGSVARGEDRPESDVDFLIDVTAETTSWFPTGLIHDLEKLLGRRVEIVTEKALNKELRERVLRSRSRMKDDIVYLHHIADCLLRIEKNTTVGLDEFLKSKTLQDATLRNLQTMSEATQRLSDEIKSTRPDIEWERIGAFRNVLVHNYLGIDMELIWTIIERDMPALKGAVSEMLGKK